MAEVEYKACCSEESYKKKMEEVPVRTKGEENGGQNDLQYRYALEASQASLASTFA